MVHLNRFTTISQPLLLLLLLQHRRRQSSVKLPKHHRNLTSLLQHNKHHQHHHRRHRHRLPAAIQRIQRFCQYAATSKNIICISLCRQRSLRRPPCLAVWSGRIVNSATRIAITLFLAPKQTISMHTYILHRIVYISYASRHTNTHTPQTRQTHKRQCPAHHYSCVVRDVRTFGGIMVVKPTAPLAPNRFQSILISFAFAQIRCKKNTNHRIQTTPEQ